MQKPKILIIGAGFGGIFAAKKLCNLLGTTAEILLINKTPHFEYHAQLYKVLNDGSPRQACIPLKDIFDNTNINLVEDEITRFDTLNKVAFGKDNIKYHFDYAVIGLGSENVYYGIPGMSKFSYSFRSINEVVRLSRHIHELIEEQSHNNAAQKETIEIVVAGGGPNGVEIAGELAEHIQLVALSHRLDPKVVHIRLVEGMDHIMPMLNKEEAKKIRTRLETLGVTVEEKTTIKEDTPQGLITDKDLIKTRTVIWVAGAKAHHLYTDWNFPTEKNGRVKVTAYLQPSAEQNMENIYIVGDGAQVEGSGQAWPALVQGEIAGRNIYNSIKQRPLVPYVPPEPMMLLPVGYDWVYAKVKGKTYWGTVGSLIRQLHTMKFYFKLLPFNKAWEVIKSGGEMCHSCNICLQNESQKLN